MTVERISHRTLRNESGRILKAVEHGESFVITNNGNEVATITPLNEDPFCGLAVTRSDPEFSFSTLSPEERTHHDSNAQLLDYLRGDR